MALKHTTHTHNTHAHARAHTLPQALLESFPEEPPAVQLALVTATVKLFLKKPTQRPQQMIQLVLTYATQARGGQRRSSISCHPVQETLLRLSFFDETEHPSVAKRALRVRARTEAPCSVCTTRGRRRVRSPTACPTCWLLHHMHAACRPGGRRTPPDADAAAVRSRVHAHTLRTR